uniref:Uncharacterized protein n=1 Tax=Anguilla anguilla TaxID=7936 RepID=A0A0E9ULJ5_ANGAN
MLSLPLGKFSSLRSGSSVELHSCATSYHNNINLIKQHKSLTICRNRNR